MTENKNHYEPPRSKLLIEEPTRNEKAERVLRKLLRGVFATYAGFMLLFCVVGVLGILQTPSIQLSVSLFNMAVIGISSILAFKAMKQSAAAALRYAVVIFLFGFGSTAIYRAIYFPESSFIPDLSNFLIFGIPAALTYYCSRLSIQRPAPNDGSEAASA